MVTTAITSRGCPHSCPFCLTYKKQYRIRDIDDILDEIEDYCIDRYHRSPFHRRSLLRQTANGH